MEMLPKQSTLVLLTVAAAVTVISAQVTVILDEKQTRRVDVPFGSSLTLCCPFSMDYERARVSWYLNRFGSSFNGTHKIYNETIKKSKNTSTETFGKTEQNLRDTEETLLKYSLSYATHNDSGWYFCKVTVEIPLLKHIKYQGAEVVIIPLPPKNRPLLDKLWIWILLGVGLVLMVLLIICVLLRRRLRGSRDSECPIYINMRHPASNSQPSPRPGTPAAGKLQTVSSAQNLRTPSPNSRYNEGKRRH